MFAQSRRWKNRALAGRQLTGSVANSQFRPTAATPGPSPVFRKAVACRRRSTDCLADRYRNLKLGLILPDVIGEQLWRHVPDDRGQPWYRAATAGRFRGAT